MTIGKKIKARLETELVTIDAEIASIEQQQMQIDGPECERFCVNDDHSGLDICIQSCDNYSFCTFVAKNQNMPFMEILDAGIKMIGVSGLMEWHTSGGCAICNPNLVCDESHIECIEAAALECKTCMDNRTTELATLLGELRKTKIRIENRLLVA